MAARVVGPLPFRHIGGRVHVDQAFPRENADKGVGDALGFRPGRIRVAGRIVAPIALADDTAPMHRKEGVGLAHHLRGRIAEGEVQQSVQVG